MAYHHASGPRTLPHKDGLMFFLSPEVFYTVWSQEETSKEGGYYFPF
jgi:hypothetical protein